MKLTWKDEKMEDFTYSITTINKDGSVSPKTANSKSTDNCEFKVAKKLTFYSFLSAGILYTNFTYPTYGIDSNKKVAKMNPVKVNLRPAAFLNLLLRDWDPVYPFLQLGITVGNNDVIIPLGIGLSIQNKFSISGGAMLGYVKDLNNLQVGQTSDQVSLNNDLTNKPIVSWYFSVNYAIVKK